LRPLDLRREDGLLTNVGVEEELEVRERGGRAIQPANGLVRFDNSGSEQQVLTRADGLIADHLTDVAAYRAANGLAATDPVPADAVTRSGSGLDPHISIDNAGIQARRVATARDLPLEKVQSLVAAHTEARDLGVFGEPRVNVLLLNSALDQLSPTR